ncbi:MAG: hypothetical protein HZA94_03795 [Candidatus Vogelbacteria bacterium]|nr:hypothetical protein [Candidatus Vogelbacteria bacterium]
MRSISLGRFVWAIALFSIVLSFTSSATVAEEKALPFYFPQGVIQTKDPVKQMQEYARYLAATTYRFQGSEHNPNHHLVPGSDSIVIQTDIDSTTRVASDGKVEKCRIVLDHFVRMPGGKIRVTQLADQFFISEMELKVVVDDLANLVKEASQGNYEFYKELSDMALRARAAKIFASSTKSSGHSTGSAVETVATTQLAEFRKMLDERDPLYGITLRELHYLPKPVKPSDFVPYELHLGYTPEIEGIFGVCWLNTGIVYYNPQARIADYLVGKPKTLQHEMVHCNYNLEKFPLANGFDAELFAMFPVVFYDEDQVSLFWHGYCQDLREVSEVYFGFDWKEARRQIFKYNLAGSLIVDEAKWREYGLRINEIKKELKRAVGEFIIPEFYSDPLWWSAMHDKLRDKNGLFWIMMARHYKPTILNNARETAIWLSAHHEEIMEMAEEAFKQSGEDGGVKLMVNGSEVSPSLLSGLSRFVTQSDQRKIKKHFENHPESLKRLALMRPDEVIIFLRGIIANDRAGMEVMQNEK